MDSDLSLIEIAAEDDSLLQPVPGGGGGAVSRLNRSNTVDYFFCSPLQVPRSNSKPIECVAANEGLEDTKRSFYRDSANKENFNVEKAETPKLSIEPQQMKRKKRGVGYNLRKSLAWDRAFFTEEGVLDATELSMINGSFSKSNGQTLSAIQEESVSNSSDLQALEENLFKELPRVTTSEKTKKNSGSLLPKKRNNEAPTSVATRKVLSTQDVNRTGSKRSACARPVASSSLKRPANSVTTKTLAKDSKVSKLPVQKPSPSAPSRASKSSTRCANDSKRSQITRPAVNTQKNAGLKGSLNNTKSIPNTSKAAPAGKSLTTKTSLGQAKRNVVSSVKCSLTTLQSPLRTEGKNDLEVIPNPSHSSTGFPSNVQEPVKVAILPQNVQQTQIQMAKPTGLRMPSPSLGFFGRSKAPPLQSPLKMTSQPCNVPESNISSLRKLGTPTPVFAPKPPVAPRSLPEVTNCGTTTANIKASSSSSPCSVFPAVKPVIHERVELNSQPTNMQKVEQKIMRNNSSFEAIQTHKELQGCLDQQTLGKAGQYTTKASIEKEDVASQRNDWCLLLKGTLQQLDKNDTSRKAVDGSKESPKRSESENLQFTTYSSSEMEDTGPSVKHDMTDYQLAEDKPHHLPLNSPDVSSSENCSVNEPLGERAEVVNLLTHEADPISRNSHMLPEIVADVNSKVYVSSVSETEKFNAFSQSTTEQEKDDTIALDKVTTQSSIGDVGLQSLDGDITVKSSNSNLSTLVNIQHNVVVGNVYEEPELLESPKSLTRVEALQDGVTLHVDDCLLGEKSFLPEEAKQENVPLTDEPEGTDASESGLKCSSDPSLVPVTLLDCGFNMAKVFECQNQEDDLGVKNYHLDTQFQHDIGLRDETILMELGNMDDHLADVAVVEDVHVSCQNNGQENSNISSAFCSIVQVECDPLVNHMIEQADVEDKKLNSSVECPYRNSTSQPEDNFCPNRNDSSFGQNCLLRGEEDVNKHQENQDKQKTPCFSEIDRISNYKKQLLEVNWLLFENTHSLDESEDFKNGSSANFNQKISAHEGSGLENPGLSLHGKIDYVVEELEKVNYVNKELDENSEFRHLGTEEDTPENASGVGLNHPSQEDHVAEVRNEENERGLQQCGDDEIEQMDNSAEVLNEGNDFESGVEQCDFEPKVFTTCNQVTPIAEGSHHVKDLKIATSNFHNENKEAASLKVEAAVTSSLETEPPVENLQLSQKHEINNKLSIEAHSLKSDLGAKQSDNQASAKSTLEREDKDVTREGKNSGIDKKQDNLVIRPPTNAVPFSDEWLAAIEAAGEEILTMKGGAVQNSPQDRSQPEPGPWSPVKRKHNQAIGPFDCTKYTNH